MVRTNGRISLLQAFLPYAFRHHYLNELPVHHGSDDLRLADLFRRALEDVGVDDDDVSAFADFKILIDFQAYR